MQTNPMLLIDFYKAVHAEMLPKGMTKSVSYFTPRMTRVEMWKEVVMFGLQPFIKTYLVDYFNENFFKKTPDLVIGEYKRIMDASLGPVYNIEKIKELHKLGYLPIEVFGLPEGTLVPVPTKAEVEQGEKPVPMFGITNTHKNFAWLPQSLESLISAEMWHPMISATVGHSYRKIVNQYYDLTCDNDVLRAKALGSFDFRGEECLESAVKASAGWCMSFLNTATVPVIPFLEQYYNCDCTKEAVAYGSVSTEHAVMCSNYAIDGDEETLIKRLLTEIYPNTSFSAVLDSYDYWNIVDNILPKLKQEILTHNGCLLIRGDSGDCIEVVTKTVFKLWEIFGGTINSKGYKVLNPHVKAIYGDSITIKRCQEIYKILTENGFACSNVALGVGSFSFQCVEENGTLKPFTRDTFSSAIKATYCEIDGVPYPIFKDPKEGGFKKSQKGCCRVFFDNLNNKLAYEDELTWEQVCNSDNNLFETVFKDGKLFNQQTLNDVRQRLHKNKF